MARLIVAEDDANVRAMLCCALIQGGHEVIETEDGQQAWEQLQAVGADAVVMDLNMPRMDGIELCRRIRRSEALRRTPILMLTIRALVEDQVRGYDNGADEYLTKPVETSILLARVKALVSRSTKGA